MFRTMLNAGINNIYSRVQKPKTVDNKISEKRKEVAGIEKLNPEQLLKLEKLKGILKLEDTILIKIIKDDAYAQKIFGELIQHGNTDVAQKLREIIKGENN